MPNICLAGLRSSGVILALLLAGCMHDAPPVTPVAASSPPPPRPEMVYFRQGASGEDFERARAQCRMNANMKVDVFDDPYRWTMIQRDCMRAAGWTLVPKI